MPNNTILITGAAGFIGFHVAQRLLSDGREVDSVNDYYNPKLKEALARASQAQFEVHFCQA